MLLGLLQNLGTTEIILIVGVLFLFFGAAKLPQAGQALGLGIRNFKKAMNGDEVDVTPGKGDKSLKSGDSEDEAAGASSHDKAKS